MHFLHFLHIVAMSYDLVYSYTAWVERCQSTIVYERKETAQVLYVIPVSSILGRLLLVPVGKTSTILFGMLRESADFLGAVCDKTKSSSVPVSIVGAYVSSWALG
jgi:hypothetical protein